MKKTGIMLLLLSIFVLPSCKINNVSEIAKIKKEIKTVYGDKIDNISVTPLLKEDGYQIIVDLVDEDKHMMILETNPKENTYVKDYWTNWMKSESDRIVKSHFGGDIYCSKVYLTPWGYSQYMPGDKVTPYDEFISKYCSESSSYIVFKSSDSVNNYSKKQFYELATELKNSGMRFDEISFFFGGDSAYVNIPYQCITDDFNEFSFEVDTH